MQKVWYTIGGTVLSIFLGVLLPGPMTLLLALSCAAVGALLGFLLGLYFIARSRGEDPADLVSEAVQQATQADPGELERPVHEELARCNLALRTDGDVTSSVMEAVETLVDTIRRLIPQVMEKSTGSEMTYNIERLGVEHLPRLVREFLAMAAEDRAEKESGLLETISNISSRLAKAEAYLNQGEVREFEAESGFMNMKFSD